MLTDNVFVALTPHRRDLFRHGILMDLPDFGAAIGNVQRCTCR